MTSRSHHGPAQAATLPVLRPGADERAPDDRIAWHTVTHRHVVVVVSVLFLLPNILIARAFSPLAALLVVLACAGSLYVVVSAVDRRSGLLAGRVQPGLFAVCWLAAAALCVLGGEGHFFFANYDWLTRDAVLADLVQHGFPVTYDYQGTEFVLRAPLGMYMVPAAIGQFLGLRVAHFALLAQNVTLLALTLSLLAAMARGRKAVFVTMFVAFSGVEIVGKLIHAVLEWRDSGSFEWPVHAHEHLGWWNPFFQYTSHVAQIFWVPNHSLPGWWLAALGILHARREIGSGILIVAVGFLFLWSPLTMAGALPIVAYLVLRRDFAALLTPRLLVPCVVALGFLPIAAYLGADAGSVPHAWPFVHPAFWSFYVVFIVIQIPHAGVVAASWQRVDPDVRPLVALAIVLLLLIPFYRLGANNDFVMRASIMPLALLAFAFASLAADLQWRDGAGRIAAVAVIVALSCVTPAMEFQRALDLHSFAISDCNLLTTWKHLEPKTWPANYLAQADRVPAWLLRRDGAAPAITIEDRQCWPDHPYSNTPTTLWWEPATW